MTDPGARHPAARPAHGRGEGAEAVPAAPARRGGPGRGAGLPGRRWRHGGVLRRDRVPPAVPHHRQPHHALASSASPDGGRGGREPRGAVRAVYRCDRDPRRSGVAGGRHRPRRPVRRDVPEARRRAARHVRQRRRRRGDRPGGVRPPAAPVGPGQPLRQPGGVAALRRLPPRRRPLAAGGGRRARAGPARPPTTGPAAGRCAGGRRARPRRPAAQVPAGARPAPRARPAGRADRHRARRPRRGSVIKSRLSRARAQAVAAAGADHD